MNSQISPQNIQAEMAVLGGILVENDVIRTVLDALALDDFYKPSHRKIFEAMIEMYNRNERIDQITLSDFLTANRQIESVGGSFYLTSLEENLPTVINIASYAKIVHREGGKRRLIQAAYDLIAAANDPTQDVQEALQKLLNFPSDPKRGSSEGKFEMNAETLRRKVKTQGQPVLEFLPVLGEEKFIIKNWSHILAGYPKGGKTELLVRAIATWEEERVLYVTEEPTNVWNARLDILPELYRLDHVSLHFALGKKPSEILNRINMGNETVVVIDTIRNLLGFSDETDNSEVARAMIPYVAACRQGSKTSIFAHHDRKGGGEHGEGISGAHAFMGIVDIALELKRVATDESKRRLLRGWGRVIEVPKLIYELRADGMMAALGSPTQIAIGGVMDRASVVLRNNWLKTREVKEQLGDPKPSDDQLAKALEALAKEGRAERNPPMSDGKCQGAAYRWRGPRNFTSHEASSKSEAKLDTNRDEWEDVS